MEAERQRTPREIGNELEDAVEAFLRSVDVPYLRPHRFRYRDFGLWDIDFYVKAEPAILISCKNPTKQQSIIDASLSRRSRGQVSSRKVQPSPIIAASSISEKF